MFSYYGSKSKVVQYYPKPMYDTIIEPFAGSARYSLYGDNWRRNVILVDKYDVIARMWRWLQTHPNCLRDIPELSNGDDLRRLDIDNNLRDFLGFIVNEGSATPKNLFKMRDGLNFNRNWRDRVSRISGDLYKIQHWRVVQGDYRCLANQEATWFIDPPYQYGGEYYKHSSKRIDYSELREWCQSRKGQVIVCENTKATWMNFTPLKSMHGSKHTTTEAMWTNMPQTEQLKLE